MKPPVMLAAVLVGLSAALAGPSFAQPATAVPPAIDAAAEIERLDDKISGQRRSMEELKTQIAELKAVVEQLSEKTEADGTKLIVEQGKVEAALQKIAELKERQAALEKAAAAGENRLFDWGVDLALDMRLAQGEYYGDGLFLRRAAFALQKDLAEDAVRLRLEPQFNGYSREFSLHSAFVDLNFIKRGAKAAAFPADGEKATTRPALFGRDVDYGQSRYSSTHLALQAGAQAIPFGVFARYVRPRDRWSASEDLVGRLHRALYEDLALRLYGGSAWVLWDAYAARGELDAWATGARAAVVPLDKLELGLSWRMDFVDLVKKERTQGLAAYGAWAVWRMEFLAQYDWRQVVAPIGDRLFDYGGSFETRIAYDPVYAYARWDGEYRGADGFYWRLTPGAGFWAYKDICTVRAEYMLSSAAHDDIFLIQVAAFHGE